MTETKPVQARVARSVALGAMTAAVSACGHLPIAGPAFEAMEAQRAGMPADWIVAPMTGDPSAIVSDYSVFGDPQLTALVQEALENNRTLRATQENVRQSEALLRQTRSGLWPRLTASVGVSSSSRGDDDDTAQTDEGASLEDESYSFAVNGAWSPDIMGDLSASIRASQAGLRSTEATYELARRQLAAQVARAYFQVIERRLQLELARRSLERAQATFRITEIRFEAGSVARDELVLGQSTLATQEAAIITAEVQLRTTVRALEAALGRFPQNALEVNGALPVSPDAPPLGLPELTIRARPDVVAAEFGVIQQFGNNRVVRLSRWPQLDATLGLAISNATQNSTSGLFDIDGVIYSIGATLAQTIFDGGAINARIDQSDAARRAALSRYGQTVIDAYRDTVDALDNFSALRARLNSLQVASEAARETLRLGELRYNEGSESLLNVLNVRDRADTAESTYIANQRAVLEQWIALHLALGGDPTQPTPVPTPARTAEGQR